MNFSALMRSRGFQLHLHFFKGNRSKLRLQAGITLHHMAVESLAFLAALMQLLANITYNNSH